MHILSSCHREALRMGKCELKIECLQKKHSMPAEKMHKLQEKEAGVVEGYGGEVKGERLTREGVSLMLVA